jgi:peptidoglycan/xylan/chitin deacetylase (PgdA/CDA1 family)
MKHVPKIPTKNPEQGLPADPQPDSGTLRTPFSLRLLSLMVGTLLMVFEPVITLAQETKIHSRLPEKVVVLTFDDSVRSHRTIVAPLLKELGFSATFFITEGFDFKTNKQDYMTWKQIRELHEQGFEVGNHSRDHMGVTAQTVGQLREQLQAINDQCREYGIPKPVSFAYPGNAFVLEALPILESMGIRYARRGGSPEYTYEEGGGVAYEPGRDHALLIPSVGDARPDWTMVDFRKALDRAGPGTVAVLQFHGVPDNAHPWVHTPPERFAEYMQYLKKEGYTVLAMRDLGQYVDLNRQPKDPEAVIRQRVKNRQKDLKP